MRLRPIDLTESLPNRGIQECITKPKAFGARAFSTTIYYSSLDWANKVKNFFGASKPKLVDEIHTYY